MIKPDVSVQVTTDDSATPYATVVLDGVTVMVYHPEDDGESVSVQIETEGSAGEAQKVRVMLNDADLFIGDPEKDENPYARQVQAYYEENREELLHRKRWVHMDDTACEGRITVQSPEFGICDDHDRRAFLR